MKIDMLNKILFILMMSICVSCSSVDGDAIRNRQDQDLFNLYIRGSHFETYPKYRVGNISKTVSASEISVGVREKIIGADGDTSVDLSEEELRLRRKNNLDGWGRLLKCDGYLGVFRSAGSKSEFLVCKIETGEVYHVRFAPVH
ncbi:hypothetical protein [Rariglobus hedericola]|uniref:Uncharacterized protein n=1 Tax=Rariglobus hedericola TaxID=2597822 RepID=A0A556QJI6_9BACT|nr:hypothetical protein [Rariglobus hedericola]TSJ76771.1 hypothetical protein FPL22_11645 [Rariglobus hedericola]